MSYKMSERPLVSKKEIEERLDEIAAEVKACGFDVILSILSGSFIFAADLCRRVATPALQIKFIRASSYGNSTESSGDLKISGLENIDIRGKKVLVVDDILDTGITLSKVCEAIKAYSPAELRTCVLLDKGARRTVNFNADFVGFNIENKFVVGYGLDYADDYRTFPEIWTLEETDGQ